MLVEALKFDPYCQQALLELGRTEARLGYMGAAVTAFGQAASVEPDAHLAHEASYSLGKILADRGDLDGATAAYENSLRITGPNGPAMSRLETLHLSECGQEMSLRFRSGQLARSRYSRVGKY